MDLTRQTTLYIPSFDSAQEAFEFLYDYIMKYGVDVSGTKAIYSSRIMLLKPFNNLINTPWRKWNKDYADYEWEWYLKGDRSVEELEKRAKIWSRMYNPDDPDKKVNSNYGYQWERNNQLDKVIDRIKKDKFTRQGVISIYDGKEIDDYEYDTPCTNTITFFVKPYTSDFLNMEVNMRSNDLVFGFCNDQYFFSKLHMMVAERLGLNVGTYVHLVTNMHIYERHFNMEDNFQSKK